MTYLDNIFFHFKLGFNTGDLWGDNGVGPDGGSDFGDGNGISRCRSLVGGCRGNGNVGCGCSRDYWGCNGHGALRSLSGFSNVSVSGCLADFSVLGISVPSLDSLGAHLDSFVSDNLKRISYFSLFQKYVFIFRMRFPFQNVVLF